MKSLEIAGLESALESMERERSRLLRIEAMLAEVKEKFNALTPEQRIEMQATQRRSWVIGNFMLDHPEATREEVEALYDKIISR